MLSKDASNALLKIMEEPPAHVIFILATTEVQKMLPTILSRCQRFDFRRIGADTIAARLLYIAGEEGFSLHPDAAHLLGRLADGGMRDALSLLDLCRSHSGEQGKITVQTVSDAAGLVPQDYLFDLAAGVAAGDLSAVMDLIAKVGGQAVEYDRLCSQLVGHFRNLLMVLSSRDPGELIVCLPETLERYREQAGSFTVGRLIHAVRVLQEVQSAMTRTSSRRTELEMGAIRLCDPRLDQSPEALLQRVDQLEAKLNAALAGGLAAPAPAAPQPAAPPRGKGANNRPTTVYSCWRAIRFPNHNQVTGRRYRYHGTFAEMLSRLSGCRPPWDSRRELIHNTHARWHLRPSCDQRAV